MKKQMSYLIARANIPLSWVHLADGVEDYVDADGKPSDKPPPTLSEELVECLGNIKLSKHFRNFGKAVGVEDPKAVEDVYKSHLEKGGAVPNIGSSRTNLATTIVNAFVNAGFGNDKLVVDVPEGQSFIYQNKDHGMMSATASVGMSMLWDPEAGIDLIDKYTYSSEERIKAGAFLAMGMLHSNLRTDPDVVYALLEEHVDSNSTPLRVGAINGIGIAYTGTRRPDIADKLSPIIDDTASALEVRAMAALNLGFLFVGSGNGDMVGMLLNTLASLSDTEVESQWAIFFSLALALVLLGRQDDAQPVVSALDAFDNQTTRGAAALVTGCAFAGTGNVLKIQELLQICSDHAEKPKKEADAVEEAGEAPAADAEGDISMDATPPSATPLAPAPAPAAPVVEEEEQEPTPLYHQSAAVISIALVAMGEEVGAEMALRQFQHLVSMFVSEADDR
jgi:26S proteasome regulatory subunit N1